MMQIYNFYSTPPNFLPSFCYLDFTFLFVYVHIGNFYSFLGIFLCNPLHIPQTTNENSENSDENSQKRREDRKCSLPKKNFVPAQKKIRACPEKNKSGTRNEKSKGLRKKTWQTISMPYPPLSALHNIYNKVEIIFSRKQNNWKYFLYLQKSINFAPKINILSWLESANHYHY